MWNIALYAGLVECPMAGTKVQQVRYGPGGSLT